jgi:hypothetical protein
VGQTTISAVSLRDDTRCLMWLSGHGLVWFGVVGSGWVCLGVVGCGWLGVAVWLAVSGERGTDM